MIHCIPKSNKAQGACSLEDPHPKFSPAIIILLFDHGSLFKIKSTFLLYSSV